MFYVVLVSLAMGLSIAVPASAGNCDYSWQYDSAGRRCGGRAASVRPGGRLGGDGRYTDSLGRNRVYGRGNDIYDRDSTGWQNSNSYTNNNSFYDSIYD